MFYPVGGNPALKKASPDEAEAIRRLNEKKSAEILPSMGCWVVTFAVAAVAAVAAAVGVGGVVAGVAVAWPGLKMQRMRRRMRLQRKGTFQGTDASLRNRPELLPDWLGIQRRTCRKEAT